MHIQVNEEELKQNRELLLEKNRKLDDPTISTPSLDPEEEMEDVGDEKSDLYDDIMMLNEEVELQDSHVCRVRGHLKKLGEVLRQAQNEDIGETDEYRASAELAVALVTQFAKYKGLERKLNKVVASITELQKKAEVDATPLSYMLQLPPTQVHCCSHTCYHTHTHKHAHTHTCTHARMYMLRDTNWGP